MTENVTLLVTRDSSRPRDGSGTGREYVTYPSYSTVVEKRTANHVAVRYQSGFRRDCESHVTPSVTRDSLSEFAQAPAAVQAEFFARLRAEADAETDFRRWMAEVESEDPVPPRAPRRLSRRRVRWDETWRRRARGARSNASGRDFDAERERLRALEASEYVPVLASVEVRYGKAECPLHDERTASLHVYPDGGGWHCFGCDRGGDVYDLAGALWELDPRSPQFREIHDRLCSVFA